MNETLKVLETRRSCRNFKPDMVKEEDLKAILEAGTYAATGMGMQSPIIIAVTDKATRDALSAANAKIAGMPEGTDPFYGAPVILKECRYSYLRRFSCYGQSHECCKEPWS